MIRSTALFAVVVAISGAPQAIAQPEGGAGGGGGSSGVSSVSTTGPVPLTGTTAETNVAALKIPAGSMGLNGMVEVQCVWSMPTSSNAKIMSFRMSSTPNSLVGGLLVANVTATTSQSAQMILMIRNNNSASSQLVFSALPTAPYAVSGSILNTFSVNTAADAYINISGTLAVTTETLTLQHCAALIFKGN